ncbi:uncharacterized protein ACA1_154700 [Acanthamoeba castellanii str. Neff]|uniref:Uncharacterized protein n=1 Tax=Acanthamoeba castellanii (strain ATCC 30010 / Neff) TaxID=1257118 RepID=L8GZ83_ACACF|nr:uncharacterized protein ACA1_154700 [Acanthamoeba castellanii str. Neff]ELR18554.1 hypothetical protein ACA1_154700 [Acanthamoeba castellanii str. Neff]
MPAWSIITPWGLALGGLTLAYANLLVFRIDPMGPKGISKQAKALALIMPVGTFIASAAGLALLNWRARGSTLQALLLVLPVLIAIHAIMKTPPSGDPREWPSEKVKKFNSHWLWW